MLKCFHEEEGEVSLKCSLASEPLIKHPICGSKVIIPLRLENPLLLDDTVKTLGGKAESFRAHYQ